MQDGRVAWWQYLNIRTKITEVEEDDKETSQQVPLPHNDSEETPLDLNASSECKLPQSMRILDGCTNHVQGVSEKAWQWLVTS
ncbi:TTC21B [Symbiodinium sp. CCMP2592]|nr:TTC21B [Symbiodinium sp. CCMP2592]